MPGQVNKPLFDSNQLWNSTGTAKQIQDALEYIYSNKNLGLTVRTFTSATALDVSDVISLMTADVTLPPANSWSTVDNPKSPLLIIFNGAGVNRNVFAAGTDTINGGASIALVPGQSVLLFNNGSNAWLTLT